MARRRWARLSISCCHRQTPQNAEAAGRQASLRVGAVLDACRGGTGKPRGEGERALEKVNGAGGRGTRRGYKALQLPAAWAGAKPQAPNSWQQCSTQQVGMRGAYSLWLYAP